MTGGVNPEGVGGADPQIHIDFDSEEEGSAGLEEVQAKANELPGSLGETGEASGVGGDIPRPQLSESTISGTLSSDPDEAVATGSSSVMAAHGSAAKAAPGIETSGSQIPLTNPVSGAQLQGEINDNGTLSVSFSPVEGEHRGGMATFTQPQEEGGNLTVSVEAFDSEYDPGEFTVEVEEEEVTLKELEIEVEETTDEEGLKKERAEDLEENPEDNQRSWINWIGMINKILEPCEKWIKEHQGAGKGSGLV